MIQKINRLLPIVGLLLLFCCFVSSDRLAEHLFQSQTIPVEYDVSRAHEVVGILTAGGGHDGILRMDEEGRLLFSPRISQLEDLINEDGHTLDEYSVQLTFTLTKRNQLYWVYPTVNLPIEALGEKWVDIVLQDKETNCGFCPTAKEYYRVDVTVLEGDTPLMKGTWQYVRAADKYTESPYYQPTEIPSEAKRNETPMTVRYLVKEGGNITGQTVQNLYVGAATEEVTASAAPGYMFAGWSDGVLTESRSNDKFVQDTDVYAQFVKVEFDKGIPNMYIMVEGGNITSKHQYKKATITIMGAAEDKYNVTMTTAIRGRGNSTFYSNQPLDVYDSKNSYRLKLDEKANLLGIGGSSNRDWVLNANKYDPSNLRNYFVWNMAKQMGTMHFVPGCTFVNLYLNGDYRGLYMLTDHVEVANDRVEINDTGSNPDKDYLIELDFRAETDSSLKKDLHYFYIPGFYDKDIEALREWVIKSEVTSEEECAFIKDYFTKCHDAIMSGDRARIDELVDIPSLLDFFIIEELSRDCDVSATSQFWVKEKGGKLQFAVPWDYDAGFGTYSVANKLEGFVCEDTVSGNKPHLWLAALIEQDWFRIELYARMYEVSDMIETAAKSSRMIAEILSEAMDHTNARWDIFGKKYHWFPYDAVSVKLRSYEEHVNFLLDWIDTRWNWMIQEMWMRLTK